MSETWQVDEIAASVGPCLAVVRLWEDGDGIHTDEIAEVVMEYAGDIPARHARLIAAAPEAVAALEAIVSEDDRLAATGECITSMGELIDVARTVIAKARGGAA